jgi:tripartite-type tricarboxylate transporter receptor subunit TctC
MVQDLLAGNIDLWFGSTDQLPLVRAGSIKAYAVTGEMRLAAAPDIPTFDEMGLPADGVETPSWHGLFAPSGTPKEVISKLDAAVVDALADPAAATAKPHRYYGTVTLDASRVGRDAGRIADEVVAHLTGLVGSINQYISR